MFRSRIFVTWFITALIVWAVLFREYCGLGFLREHLYYPLIMVLGAFVAGMTPEGGGAVAFPALSLFFDISREWARDFSLMIQSIGMTSASLFVLTHPDTDRRAFLPLFWLTPIACLGFLAGLQFLQGLPVVAIHVFFLSLITAFALSYALHSQRGQQSMLLLQTGSDYLLCAGTAIAGGMAASLFGTGADILFYTLVVSRFGLAEKTATRLSVVLMTCISVCGFGWRHFVDADMQLEQYQGWLCAWPVVLFMAPFGAWVLHRIHVELMIRGLVILNMLQLLYFNLREPSVGRITASCLLTSLLFVIFRRGLRGGDGPAVCSGQGRC
jgi:uncharacterized membrane protein YfcA